MSDLDLRIVGGFIVDGTGAAGFEGDVGIHAGRIVEIGNVDAPAARTIDARGLVVAPGFIDIHTHYDAQLFWDPLLTISPYHGVTTVVTGNCGFGIAPTRREHQELMLRTLEKVEGMPYESTWAGLSPHWDFETFPEYLQAIERRGPGVNVCPLIPHTPLRLYVMGDDADQREASRSEIAAMARLVSEAMEAGAWGFSTSNHTSHVGYQNRLVPSLFASEEEYRSLVFAMAESGRGTVETTRGAVLTLDRMAELIEATGRPITLSALVTDEEGKGSHRELLAEIEAIQAEGLQLWPQVSPRPIVMRFTLTQPNMLSHTAPGTVGGEFLDDLFTQLLDCASLEERLDLLHSSPFRSQLRERTSSPAWTYLWETTVVAEVEGHPELTDHRLVELAKQRGVHPSDVMLDVGIESGLTAVFALKYLNGDEKEVARLLEHPGTRLGITDGGAHVSELCDACYPTDLLGSWVREKGVLTLEQAIFMLSARSAAVYGIRDRGTIMPGAAADLVAFDPDRIGAGRLRRAADLPAGVTRLVSDAQGVEHVIVNGKPLIHRGERVAETLPGQLLRSTASG